MFVGSNEEARQAHRPVETSDALEPVPVLVCRARALVANGGAEAVFQRHRYLLCHGLRGRGR